MKRILLLADVNSPHIQKWVTGLSQHFHIGVFSISKSYTSWYEGLVNFELFDQHGFGNKIFHRNVLRKIVMLGLLPSLKSCIKEFRPDILHAHYATSYGLLGRLSRFHPYFISVWGSDVYDFPKEGFFQRRILKNNLRSADRIFSTSRAMAVQTQKFTDKTITCIPFGIDTEVFKPLEVQRIFNGNPTVVGMVKTMQEKYGVQHLIRAFHILKGKDPDKALKLLLVGGGTQRPYLEKLCADLDIAEDVVFTGEIPYRDVVQYHNQLDIAVYPSTLDSESFGVAALESAACEKAVIVSNVDGLKEVIEDGKTGIVIPKENVEAIASAIGKLLADDALRMQLAKNARAHVKKEYEWKHCLQKMMDEYQA